MMTTSGRTQQRRRRKDLLYRLLGFLVFASSALTTLQSLTAIHRQTDNLQIQQVLPHKSKNKFAIAYVIGGCAPEDPSYRYYLYDILISVDYMRREGSKADVICFVQMAKNSKFDALTEQDQRMLSAKGVTILYIPKNPHESFYSVMLDKFRILSLEQYDRVLFSDGDVVIRGSLDYLYELSVNNILKENIVMAGKTEPANGGFFMLRPRAGALRRIRRIIAAKEARGAALDEYPNFDRTVGWGHNFTEHGDSYELINHKKHDRWEFHGDFADQGLLYQWTKYEEQSVSIIFSDGIQNWANINGTVQLETTHSLDVLDTFSKRPVRDCWKVKLRAPCRAPYTDHAHFTGRAKPWFRGPPEDWETSDAPNAVWFQELHRLNRELNLELNFSEWRTGHRPLLGMYPLHVSAVRANYTDSAIA